MPRNNHPRIKPTTLNDAAEPPSSAAFVEELSTDQLTRWADLIANGEVGFPANLPAGQLRELIAEVRQLRRNRLIDYIARAIALDIHRSCESNR